MKKLILSSLLMCFCTSPVFASAEFVCLGKCQRLSTGWRDELAAAGVGATRGEAYVALAKFCQNTIGPRGERFGLVLPDSNKNPMDLACKENK